MLKQVYSILDKVGKMHANPFVETNDGVALRAIQDVMKNENHQFARYPSDFALVKIGTFDEETGILQAVSIQTVIDLEKLKEE